jgi:hypothetical protein
VLSFVVPSFLVCLHPGPLALAALATLATLVAFALAVLALAALAPCRPCTLLPLLPLPPLPLPPSPLPLPFPPSSALRLPLRPCPCALVCPRYLHPGMLIGYLKGDYIRESKDVSVILKTVSPHISKDDLNHIRQIMTEGCPSKLILVEPSAMKNEIIAQENQQTFQLLPELVTKIMNKKGKNSHLIAVKLWVLLFSPYAQSMSKGIKKAQKKHSNN